MQLLHITLQCWSPDGGGPPKVHEGKTKEPQADVVQMTQVIPVSDHRSSRGVQKMRLCPGTHLQPSRQHYVCNFSTLGNKV